MHEYTGLTPRRLDPQVLHEHLAKSSSYVFDPVGSHGSQSQGRDGTERSIEGRVEFPGALSQGKVSQSA